MHGAIRGAIVSVDRVVVTVLITPPGYPSGELLVSKLALASSGMLLGELT